MPRSTDYPDETYNFGVTRVRQNNALPTINPPASTPKSTAPPAYTANQWAQHANAMADMDRMLAAEKDPATRARIQAQRNEMQFAYRNHAGQYPNFAARARDQQQLKTDVSVENARVGGATAVGAMRATAPVVVADINARGKVASEQVKGDVKRDTTADTNATKRDVANTSANARKYTADQAARARVIQGQLKAAADGVGDFPSPEQQKELDTFIKQHGVEALTAPSATATPSTTPSPAPVTPSAQPSAKPPTTTQSAQSTSTQAFPAQEPPAPGADSPPEVTTSLPTIAPPTINVPKAEPAPYENPYSTSVPEPAPRPKPVTGDAADPKSKTGIKLDAGNYGTSAKAYNDKKAADDQKFRETQDTNLAEWRNYRESTGSKVSLNEFVTRVKPGMRQRDDDFLKKTGAADLVPGTPEYQARLASLQPQALPTVNPPQAAPVAQPVAQAPVMAPPVQPAPAPLPSIAFAQGHSVTAPTSTPRQPFASLNPPPAPIQPPVAQTQTVAAPGTASQMVPNPDGTFSNPAFPGSRYMKVAGGFKRI